MPGALTRTGMSNHKTDTSRTASTRPCCFAKVAISPVVTSTWPSSKRSSTAPTLTGTSQSRLEQEQGGDQDGPARELDDAIQGTADADVPGSIRSRRDAGGSGEPELLGLSFGTDDVGMPSPTPGPDPTDDDQVPASPRQDLDDVRSDATAAGPSSATGDASRRIVLRSPGESSAVRQTGLGEKSCIMCVGRAVGAVGTQCSVQDMQLVGAATVDRQARPATSEVDQTILIVRGADYRRPGLGATSPASSVAILPGRMSIPKVHPTIFQARSAARCILSSKLAHLPRAPPPWTSKSTSGFSAL